MRRDLNLAPGMFSIQHGDTLLFTATTDGHAAVIDGWKECAV